MVGGWLATFTSPFHFLLLPGLEVLSVLRLEPATAEVLVSAAQTAVLVRIRIMAAAARATGGNDPRTDLTMW
jgi:hypothetical protein